MNKILKVSINRYIGNILLSIPFQLLIDFFLKRTIRYQNMTFDVSSQFVTAKSKARLFWNFYESAEIRFVEKYLNVNLDTIELGSSMGIVSCVIGKKLKPFKKLITVEANPNMESLVSNNLKMNKIENVTFLNNAYASGKQKKLIFSLFENNLVGKIKDNDHQGGVSVKTISLKSIIEKYNLKSFNLVCDIEGAEIDLILNEDLDKVESIIIELHHTSLGDIDYSVEDLNNLIKERGFSLQERYGNVFSYKKRL